MKFKLFVIILFVLGYNSLSYSQCKFEINEKDKFTGVSKLETKLEILHKDFNSAIAINFCKYNNEYFIRLGLNLSNKIYSISKGDKLMFICGDSTITLISNESNIVSGYTNIVYNLTESQIKILKSNTISDLRIYLIDSYLDKVIDSKKAEKIKLAVGCI